MVHRTLCVDRFPPLHKEGAVQKKNPQKLVAPTMYSHNANECP